MVFTKKNWSFWRFLILPDKLTDKAIFMWSVLDPKKQHFIYELYISSRIHRLLTVLNYISDCSAFKNFTQLTDWLMEKHKYRWSLTNHKKLSWNTFWRIFILNYILKCILLIQCNIHIFVYTNIHTYIHTSSVNNHL